jgi:hypothetical protein
VTIFTQTITARLQYISDFIGKEIFGEAFQLVTDAEAYANLSGPKFNYSNERAGGDEILIRPHSLLFETDIQVQEINCFDHAGHPAFFQTGGDIPFDIFAASFYLLSRYEEYLPHRVDAYGRYAHEASLAYNEKFLSVPLVNIWLNDLKAYLLKKFPSVKFRTAEFLFLPTYDIDMAWSYKHKGWWRTVAGISRSFFKGEWRQIRERISTVRGKQKDPYDAYAWMNHLHEQYNLRPYYFFLLASTTGKYDKNIQPRKKVMQDLVADHMIRYPVGIHPSWQSGDSKSLVKEEMANLSSVTGTAILSSRQHYIRFTLPVTFRTLIENGIQFDFSMGYGSINGFRASVASPFYWYDLRLETPTKLMLFPFCFMEANSFYEQKFTSAQALEEMRHYYREVKTVNGTFITIWHNSFLGSDPAAKDWKNAYEQFVREISA